MHATPFRSGLAFDKSLTVPEVSTNVYGQSEEEEIYTDEYRYQ